MSFGPGGGNAISQTRNLKRVVVLDCVLVSFALGK